MAFTLPALPYAFDALEPHIDARTMEIHHGKHHAAYVSNLNAAIAGTSLENKSLEDILAAVSQYPAAVRNNGGGHYNHSLFWETMSPNGGGEPSPQMNVAKAIERDFTSFEQFKKEFSAFAMGRFGSGWAWLCTDDQDKLFICSTPNQDNPLMDLAETKGYPLLGIDVWEHAYYLNYQNRRADYVGAFFNVINWSVVTKRYNDANPGAMKA
ncbi:MAG: superoxide dismutase [Bacteroidota bacterium]|jgi:Fe-Mn family superoxide dismutase